MLYMHFLEKNEYHSFNPQNQTWADLSKLYNPFLVAQGEIFLSSYPNSFEENLKFCIIIVSEIMQEAIYLKLSYIKL